VSKKMKNDYGAGMGAGKHGPNQTPHDHHGHKRAGYDSPKVPKGGKGGGMKGGQTSGTGCVNC
jgi:hypothetical protein